MLCRFPCTVQRTARVPFLRSSQVSLGLVNPLSTLEAYFGLGGGELEKGKKDRASLHVVICYYTSRVD